MKKTVFGAVLALALGVGMGVSSNATAQAPSSQEYMQIVGTAVFLTKKKVTIQLDYGQESNWLADDRMRDDSGKVAKYNSMMDALNHMSASGGWTFHDAYVITVANQHVYHYVLTRPKQ